MDGSYRIYRFEKEIGRVHRDRVYKTFGDSKNLNTMIVTVDDLSEKDLIVALAIGMDYIADIH
ncbi:hypothetical protein FM131_08790 [Weissella confusa]|nr:hypothetical protein FM131_08790 [Weissella confusa]